MAVTTTPEFEDLAIIMGAMKAGTSTLFEYLQSHPAVAACRRKEPDYFTSPLIWGRGEAHYRSLFDYDPGKHRLALEASTDCTKLPYCEYALDRIERSPFRTKFVYLIRNPIRRIESHHVHADRTGYEILQLKPDRTGSFSFDNGISDIAIDICRYASQLDAYVNRFGQDAVRVWFFEDLVETPERVVEEVCAWLDLPAIPLPSKDVHANKGEREVLHPAWDGMRRLKGLRQAVRLFVPERARDKLRETVGMQPRPGRFELNAAEKASVLKELEDELDRLESVYGIAARSRWGLER